MGHIELHGAPAWWCTVGKEQIEPRLKPPAWGRQGKWEGSPFMDPPPSVFCCSPPPQGSLLLLSPVPPPLRALGRASAQPYSEAGMGNGDAGAHTERGTRGVRRDGGPQGTAGSPAPWKHLFLPPPPPCSAAKPTTYIATVSPAPRQGSAHRHPQVGFWGGGGVCSSCSHASDVPAADGCWWGWLPGGLPVPGPRSVAHGAKTLPREGGKSSEV